MHVCFGLEAVLRLRSGSSLKRNPEAAIRETQIFHPFQRRNQILGHSAVGSGRTTAWTGTTALSPERPDWNRGLRIRSKLTASVARCIAALKADDCRERSEVW